MKTPYPLNTKAFWMGVVIGAVVSLVAASFAGCEQKQPKPALAASTPKPVACFEVEVVE